MTNTNHEFWLNINKHKAVYSYTLQAIKEVIENNQKADITKLKDIDKIIESGQIAINGVPEEAVQSV